MVATRNVSHRSLRWEGEIEFRITIVQEMGVRRENRGLFQRHISFHARIFDPFVRNTIAFVSLSTHSLLRFDETDTLRARSS